jgi:tetratricopeptide (TPR) repeat protein
MKLDYLLTLVVVVGLVGAAFIAHWNDTHRRDVQNAVGEGQLYLNGSAMKRLTLAFNGVAADWYWLRSLQYVGRKIVGYEDVHGGNLDLTNLSSLDLRLLPELLKISSTLDPHFLEPYFYGAVILPDVNPNEATSLLKQGIAANPHEWRLYQHLGYIYWQKRDYQKAADVYQNGAKLSGAPPWMAAISARMKAEGGAIRSAREMYIHLYESSDDPNVKHMVEKQLMRLDSLEERTKIRQVLADYATRAGHCVASWKEVGASLRAAGLRLETSGAPLDPANTPYRLIKDGCEVELDEKSPVPKS